MRKTEQREYVKVYDRKLARSIARANMKKSDISNINKPKKDGMSFFAKNWRDYVAE